MKVIEIDRVIPEIKLPIARILNVNIAGFDGKEWDKPDDFTVTTYLCFRLETPGERYSVYQLKGFDK